MVDSLFASPEWSSKKDKGQTVIMEMLIPSGTEAALYGVESEVLLGTGRSFRIVGDSTDENGVRHLKGYLES